MPTYIYTAPSGRKIKVTGESAPTTQQLEQIFKQAGVLDAPAAPARPEPARTWTDTAVDAIPTAAAGVGGLIGGAGGTAFGLGFGGVPGAVGGAALGGAAGESARQLINRVRGKEAPATPVDAASAIASEGATQGASELAGAGLVRGARMAAHGLMDFAIRPAPTVAEEFGDIATTALKERLPVGAIMPGATKGSQRARAALRQASNETTKLYTDAGARGVSFTPGAVAAGPVRDLVTDIAKQPLSQGEIKQVASMFSEYLNSQNSRMAPLAVKDMKQAAQRIARPIFRAINQGNMPAAGEALKGQFNKAIADGSKAALEAAIPGVAAAEARTQGLIGASKSIRRAEARRLPLVAEIAAPVVGGIAGGVGGGDLESAGKGITASLLTRALLSPRTTSRAALALTNDQIEQVLRQMPRAAVYSLLSDVTGTTTESAAAR